MFLGRSSISASRFADMPLYVWYNMKQKNAQRT